jgi:hypothetical protein
MKYLKLINDKTEQTYLINMNNISMFKSDSNIVLVLNNDPIYRLIPADDKTDEIYKSIEKFIFSNDSKCTINCEFSVRWDHI